MASMNQLSSFEQNLFRKSRIVKIHCDYCQEYLCAATETQCVHIFCEQCITDYLLYLDACPKCQIPLRKTTLFSNIPLDNIIQDYVKSTNSRNYFAFNQRLANFRRWKRQSKISEVRQGMQVDIRDENYVWCTGTIRQVIMNQQNQQPWVIVKYNHSNITQALNLNLGKVLTLGTYTNRSEIPRYENNKLVIQHYSGIKMELTDWHKGVESQGEFRI